jgi:hypothetical protein
MAVILELNQKGKPRSLANVIRNIESEATPYTTMIRTGTRPKQALHEWQVKAYPVVGHKGVHDGVDATSFEHNPREEMSVYAQKSWWNPGVSDFAEEAEVAGLGKGEFAEQVADAIITVKRIIEKRCVSAEDTKLENGTTNPYETRGIFSWISSTAQTTKPVPSAFLTPSAQIYTGTLAAFTEAAFKAMAKSSYKQRKGTYSMHGFVGVDLKDKFTQMSVYIDNIANTTPIARYNKSADDRAIVRVIDKLVMDSGEVLLHLSPFLYTDANTGEDTLYTHRSGIFTDMGMCFLAYTRMPRVVNLDYKGGGKRAIVDTIFLHGVENVLGAMKAEISADS